MRHPMNLNYCSGRKSEEGTELSESVSYSIGTIVRRHDEYEEMLELLVTATEDGCLDERSTETSTHEAYLRAYLMTISGLPEPCDFLLFDVVSEDMAVAYKILCNNSKKVLDVLQIEDWDEEVAIENILVIDKIEVNRECRGQGMALRLMREVKGIFAKAETLTILQARPFGDDVKSGAKEIRTLTDYYLSDSILDFQEIDAKQYPGWLVCYGTQGYGQGSDYCYFPEL